MSRPGPTDRGICPTCGRLISMRRDGTLRSHKRAGEPCAGVGMVPDKKPRRR